MARAANATAVGLISIKAWLLQNASIFAQWLRHFGPPRAFGLENFPVEASAPSAMEMRAHCQGGNMMTTQPRLQRLIDQIANDTISADETARQVRDLLANYDDAYYREKMRGALDNAEIYAGPGLHEKYGGAARVRGLLLADLTSAARRARQLNNNKRL